MRERATLKLDPGDAFRVEIDCETSTARRSLCAARSLTFFDEGADSGRPDRPGGRGVRPLPRACRNAAPVGDGGPQVDGGALDDVTDTFKRIAEELQALGPCPSSEHNAPPAPAGMNAA